MVPQEGVLCVTLVICLSLWVAEGRGSLWLRLTAEHRQAEVARVLFTHLLLEGLLLTFQQGQEAGSQTMERGTEEQTQRDRQGKTHSQGCSNNWLILQTLGENSNGNRKTFKTKYFYFSETYKQKSIYIYHL